MRQLPGVTRVQANGRELELECEDAEKTLVRLVSTLQDLRLELLSLETQEPNLERVFLQLTGRAMRD